MSLRDALLELAQSARARRPADVQGVIDAALESLRRTGIADTCLQPGETAPDFALPDTQGGTVALESLLRRGPAVVSFYRGGWCPYCNLALRAMDGIVPSIAALGGSLVAVAPQIAASQHQTAIKHGLRFPLLVDADNRVAQLFGLAYAMPPPLVQVYRGLGIDLTAANATPDWTLPLPATYVIAPDGVVAEAFVEIDYTRRAEPAAVLQALQRVVMEAVR